MRRAHQLQTERRAMRRPAFCVLRVTLAAADITQMAAWLPFFLLLAPAAFVVWLRRNSSRRFEEHTKTSREPGFSEERIEEIRSQSRVRD
jgi:hypothetical protein